MKLVAFAFAVVALVGTPGRASAQFATMDRQNWTTEGGATFDYLIVNHDRRPGTSAYRFDLFAEYVDAPSGFGGYLQLPITRATFDVAVPPFTITGSGTGVGDLELGGIYVARSRRADTHFVLHAGLTLPTSPSADDQANASQLGGLARITDITDTIPKGTSVRVAFSPVWNRGHLIARLDVGLDFNMAIASGRTTLPPLLRLNGALGYADPAFAVTFEATNSFITGENSAAGDRTLNEFGISGRFFVGDNLSLFVALVLPLEDDTRQLDAAIRFGIYGRL